MRTTLDRAGGVSEQMSLRCRTSLAVLLIGLIASAFGLVACGTSVNSSTDSAPVQANARPGLSSEVALAPDPAVTVRAYFGEPATLGDILVRDDSGGAQLESPFAFWLVQTETTPTVEAMSACLLSMSGRYGGEGRRLDLRVDYGGRDDRGDSAMSAVMFWNPSDAQTRGWGYDMDPGPRSIEIWVGEGGRFVGTPVRATVSNVTAQALEEAVRGTGHVFDEIRRTTPLR